MTVSSETLLEMTPILPIVEIVDVDAAMPLAEALKQGGIAILEVVLRTPASLEAISRTYERRCRTLLWEQAP